MASLTSYYTFYLIHKFELSIQQSQMLLFVFLGAVAAGTIIGGPLGDRFGRKYVIWVSILGVLPFTLALPYANLLGTAALSVIIGLVLASAFSAIIVFAQELVPGRVGMIAGHVLRLRLRHRRQWRGGAGACRRRQRHRLRLSPLLVPALAGTADRVLAQHREKEGLGLKGPLVSSGPSQAARSRARRMRDKVIEIDHRKITAFHRPSRRSDGR